MSRRPLYIAVEGPIGVGKTTLVAKLAERLGARVILEAFEENPFLSKFYADRERYAFPTQLFFLMSRFKQQQDLVQPDLFQPDILSDYHLLKDRIFAELTLADDELALYDHVYRSLASQILKPDVMIYLNAPLPLLLERIRQRGRDFERDFDAGYLQDLARAYQRFFSRYDDTPLLRLDNSALNYADPGAEGDAAIAFVLARVEDLAKPPGADTP